MLSEMMPEAFDELVAMDRILPFGDEKVCWTLAKGFSEICYRLNKLCESWGHKEMPVLKPSDFIPWKVKKQKPKDDYVSPNAMAAAVRMAVNR